MKASLPLYVITFLRDGNPVDTLIVRDESYRSAFEYGKELCRGTKLRVSVDHFNGNPA